MSIPQKRKINIDTNPIKSGDEYMKFGLDRINELMLATDYKTKYLPRTIRLEDLDLALFEYISNKNMQIIIDGNIVPTFYLENDRWGEFSKTWKFTDDDKNVPTPYVTIRRINKSVGTRIGTKYRVPQSKKFCYLNVPILDEGEVIYLQFRMPEPANVDLTYEVTLFTKYRVDVNVFDEKILRCFASKQDYIHVNGTPLPLTFEGFAESNPIENVDGDKFYVSKYAVKLQGTLIDESEFEIVKTLRKTKINYNIN